MAVSFIVCPPPHIPTQLSQKLMIMKLMLVVAVALKELVVQSAIPVSSQYTPTLAALFPHPVTHNKKLASPFQHPQEEKKNHGNVHLRFQFGFPFKPVCATRSS